MRRNYLLKLFLALFLFGVSCRSLAQYADLGTGALKDKIWWIDWSGFGMANGATKTFTTSNGLTVNVVFSNVSGPALTPTPMNTWYGAVLHLLYDFSNTAVLPALYNPADVSSNTNFTVTVAATRNGTAVPVQFITADAEASAVTEITTLTTNGSAWNTVDFFRNSSQTSNPLSGCNTNTVKITNTYGNSPSIGQNPVVSTQTPSGGSLVINVQLDHGGINGKMGLAFGILEAVDRGDLPASYGSAQHRIQYAYSNVCNYLPPLPSSTQDASLKLGTLPGDADGIQTLNDNAAGADEDAISSIPTYTGNGFYTLTLPVTNLTGLPAYLVGWFDMNGNGVFDTGESQTATVPANAATASLTWMGVPATLSKTANYGFRFRISSDLSAVQPATGYAKDGEVEDYLVPVPQNVVVAFTTPDTVCVNGPVNITNTSTGASNYYWNFCVANLINSPTGQNLGNIGNAFSEPVFMDYAFYNNNYYGFVVNHTPGALIRLDFGNSLLNTPTAVNLGNFGGIIPATSGAEGIQVVFNEGRWYAIIVAGNPLSGVTPRVLKVDFGSNLANASPVATSWGNLGNMSQPIDLHVFQEGTAWYGLTVNGENNTITRFNFTNSFNNTPTGTNLGNIGSLSYPTGIYAINDNGFWRVFIVNGGTGTRQDFNASLTRLDFGSSLLNTPVGVNLGNPGGLLKHPRDLTILKQCGQIIGFAVNGHVTNSDVIRLDFQNNLSSTPVLASLGNIGNLTFPHSISKLFRVNDDVYSFVTNVDNNKLSRLKFSGCTAASISGSTAQNPPSVTYNAPGTYNINLTVDDGLPTQSAYCKQVVVLPPPAVATRSDTALCPGASVTLTTTGTGVTQYSWSPATGLSNPATANPVATPTVTTQYIVTATGAGGCVARDTVVVTVKTPQQCTSVTVTAGFIVPDTVCVNTPVNVTNNSVNASSYYWNFCVANLLNAPTGQNIGNPGGAFSQPVFMDYAFDNGNYYGFLINHFPGALIRLDFGNSLLNTPTTTNLGNFGGIIPPGYGTEGIQVVFNENKWYVIVVGGYTPSGSTPRILKVEFGSSLANPSPVATNWGNLGNMLQPLDLHVFKEGNTWYGLTINAENNTITRFHFTSSFSNTPTAANLGNVGNLNYPTGIYAISDNGFWRVFVTNAGNSTLTRLDFGSSLVNAPTGVNLGNPGNVLNQARDLTILKQCGQIVGFAVNGNQASNETVKIDFKNDLSATPVLTSLGNLGSSSFPHSISKLFRVNDDVYAFITNVANNSITRLKFSGCTAASIAGSTAQTPTGITYNTAGTYNVNLTVDDGLPTQTAYCRQVVVVSSIHTPLQTKSLCAGDSVQLTSGAASGNQWSTGSTAQSIYVKAAGTYWVQSSNGGCVNIDSFVVGVKPVPMVNLGRDTALCTSDSIVLDAGNPGAAYAWQNGQTSQTFTVRTGGLFYVTVTKDGCGGRDSIVVSSLPAPVITRSADTSICKGSTTTLTASGGGTYNWSPATGLSTSTGASAVAKPDTTTKYFIAVTGTNGCRGKDSVTVTVKPVPAVNLGKDTSLCTADSLWLDAGNTGASYLWQNGQTTQKILVKGGGSYSVAVSKAGCVAKDTIVVDPLPSPVLTLTDNTSICRTASVVLNATGGSLYKWWPTTGLSDSTGAAITASPSVTTTYYLLATSNNNCTAKDSVTITVTPMPLFSVQSSKPVLCIGDTAVLSAHGGDAYAWYPAQWVSNPADSVTQAFPPATTAFNVVIEDYTCGITDTLSVRLPVADKPTVALSKSNDINCVQGQATLFAGGGTSYLWQPATGLNDARSKSPVVTVSTTTTYSVLVKTPEGCEVQDSITVYVAKGDDGSGFPVPTAFTPNGDGKNDCFSVQHWGAVTEFSLNLYNRWGERVFHADVPNQCWNGVYKGVPQPGDVYVYWIKAKTLCGEVFRKGTFALIR